MTPKFAKAVDNVFLGVLDLLERIERNQSINVSDERTRIQKRIDNAEAQLGSTQDWQLAKYALVSWIDSMLIGAPWDGNTWWENNPLVSIPFGQFFCSPLPRSDLISYLPNG